MGETRRLACQVKIPNERLETPNLTLFLEQNHLKSNTKITDCSLVPSSVTEAMPRLLRHVANKRKTRASPAPFPQDVSAP